MASNCKIEFQLHQDDWDTFIERLELYFMANDVDPTKQVAELLTKVCVNSYSLIRSLASPVKPKDLKYDEIIKLVSNHLQPKPSEISERNKFNSTRQAPNEPVNDFIVRLKRLSVNCNFENLDTSLRDQFVNGIRDQNVKVELFRQEKLDFNGAVKIAVARESAERDAVRNSSPRRDGNGDVNDLGLDE
ncbi:uncharacterized protein LOC123315976 [Coccinella septempunctata]|uniref:uncharacterized protein LOC123315976 n=1 Tax=Coccinella septempunctata TaxID=41139 RepID=UPI001D0859E4|nr:uncharacterized protein LOC123315976 [Coccinella septempunctata]